jgi:Cys-tRNA(Pro)/Cys-tRNA(Cys) deacylase
LLQRRHPEDREPRESDKGEDPARFHERVGPLRFSLAQHNYLERNVHRRETDEGSDRAEETNPPLDGRDDQHDDQHKRARGAGETRGRKSDRKSESTDDGGNDGAAASAEQRKGTNRRQQIDHRGGVYRAALGVTVADEVSAAINAAVASGIPHTVVRTEPASSAEEAADLQRIPLSALLRTIVVRRGEDDYLFVLVPAGRRFDWPKLRAHLGVTRLSLPDADEARNVTGYERYTITPFGASRAWPVIADTAILGEPVVSVGGGVRGVNIHLAPADLIRALDAAAVDVTQAQQDATGGSIAG